MTPKKNSMLTVRTSTATIFVVSCVALTLIFTSVIQISRTNIISFGNTMKAIVEAIVIIVVGLHFQK